MAILKLKNGKHNGVVATIANVEHVPTKNPKYKDQYGFTLETGDMIYCDEGATDRQVERLKLDGVMDLVGKTVTFWKRAMDGEDENGKGYLNIDLGNTVGSNGVAQRAIAEDNVTRDLRNHGVLAPKKDYDQIKSEYVACLGDAIAILNDATETFGTPFTPAEVTSVAATLYIQRSKAGV